MSFKPRSLLVTALLLCASPVFAANLDGMGRISVVAGYKWTPNWYFESKAAEQGNPLISRGISLQGAASFGYGVTSWVELAIDLIGGYEMFILKGYQPFNSVYYGGLIGGRVATLEFFSRNLSAYFGLQAGPALAQVSSDGVSSSERVVLGISVNAGLTYRVVERIGITLDVRYLYARVPVASIGAANVGGLMPSLGVTLFFPGPASNEVHELPVPGF